MTHDRAGRVVAYCSHENGLPTNPVNVRSVIDEDSAKNYRTSDEQELQTDNHEHFCNILRQSTLGFARGISVLDLGCGTGRYFHCLRNVDRLIGVDISVEMLKQARIPVKRSLSKSTDRSCSARMSSIFNFPGSLISSIL